MQFIKWYLIGLLVCLLMTWATELFYFHKGRIRYVSAKDWLEDLAYSATSWVGVLLVIGYYICEWVCDFSSYGYGYDLGVVEDNLKKQAEGKSKFILYVPECEPEKQQE